MTQPLTLSEVEEMVNEFARKYAMENLQIPERAIKIVLWPTDKWLVNIMRGPTAVIHMGILPGHPQFNRTMRDAIEQVHRKKMWESVEMERVSDILAREGRMKQWRREKYKFDSDLIPNMLHEEEVVSKVVSRVEVTHAKTGLREVVEFDSGTSNIWAAKRMAMARLARRVHAHTISNPEPWNLPDNDPNWVAKTA